MRQTKNNDKEAEELAELLDELFSAGSQHVNLEIGKETRIRTVNSTDCSGRFGACAVPNTEFDDEED